MLGSTQESRRGMGASRGCGWGHTVHISGPQFPLPPQSCSGCSSPALLKPWVRVSSRGGCRHRQRSLPGRWECGGGGGGARLCDASPEGNRSSCKDRLREHRAQMDSGQGSDAEAKLLFPLQSTLGPRLPSYL